MSVFDSDNGASNVKILGLARRPDSAFVVVFKFLSVEGRDRFLSIPREEFLTPALIAKQFARYGVVVQDEKNVRMFCKAVLDQADPLPMVQLSQGPGWYDNYAAYLYGDIVLGTPNLPIIVPSAEAEDLTLEYRISLSDGSSRKWCKLTAPFPEHSPLLVLAICSAFASVLAAPVGIESGILHWYGESTTGKTIALIVARSIFGDCRRKSLPNWNTSPAGLEEVLDQSPDQPLVLDELTFNRGDKEGAAALQHITYAVASSRRRKRSKHWAGGLVATARRGGLYVLSSGEQSFNDIIENAQLKRLKGEHHRAIDVPAEAGKGLGIFRSMPKGVDAHEYATQIEAICSANYGRVGRRFIEHLIDSEDDLVAKAKTRIDEFKTMANVPNDRLAIRFAQRFGLAYAAGVVAIEAGVVDWTVDALARSLRRVYQQARAAAPDPLRRRNDAISALNALLCNKEQVVPAEPGAVVDDDTFASSDVFQRRDAVYGRMLLVKPERFEALCGDETTSREVVAELDRRGHLIRSGSGKATRQVSIGGDITRPRYRYYCIRYDFTQT